MNGDAISRIWQEFHDDVAVTSDIVAKMAVTTAKDVSQFLVENLTVIMDTTKSFLDR